MRPPNFNRVYWVFILQIMTYHCNRGQISPGDIFSEILGPERPLGENVQALEKKHFCCFLSERGENFRKCRFIPQKSSDKWWMSYLTPKQRYTRLKMAKNAFSCDFFPFCQHLANKMLSFGKRVRDRTGRRHDIIQARNILKDFLWVIEHKIWNVLYRKGQEKQLQVFDISKCCGDSISA